MLSETALVIVHAMKWLADVEPIEVVGVPETLRLAIVIPKEGERPFAEVPTDGLTVTPQAVPGGEAALGDFGGKRYLFWQQAKP